MRELEMQRLTGRFCWQYFNSAFELFINSNEGFSLVTVVHKATYVERFQNAVTHSW